MLDTVWHDTRDAVRAMRAQRTVATVAILTLALGISVNTSIFAIATAVLNPELPRDCARRLVASPVLRRAAARYDEKSSQCGKLPAHFVSHALGEVCVL